MPSLQETLAGRYELLDVLGRGGMGVVYRARDRVLDRTVAVKVLPAERSEDPIFLTRFEREARAAASLSHPNIVAVFDYGADDATPFIVMECVPGQSLAQLLRERGPLGVERATQIAAEIASALAAAHDTGLIHRDIKPGNVVVDDAGAVKVLDFGIARMAATVSLTQTSVVLGSASYMAPEVARGEPTDARSDIYSLGCVLYEMLSGRPPFVADLPAAVMHQHSVRQPRPLRQLDRGVPVALDALVLRMLAKRRRERFPRARELPEALAAAIRAPARVGAGATAAAQASAAIAAAAAAAAQASAAARAPATGATAARAPATGATAARARARLATGATAATGVLPREPRDRRRGALAIALPAAVVLALVLVILASAASEPHRNAARSTPPAVGRSMSPKTAHRRARTRPAKTKTRPATVATTATAPTATTLAATAPAAAATPATVPAAAAALTRLVSQDVQSGAIDQQAAQQILQGMQDILSSYAIGHGPDVAHKLGDLEQRVNKLAGHGDIQPSAVPAINAAVAGLASAVARASPVTQNGGPAQWPPGHEHHGHGPNGLGPDQPGHPNQSHD